MEPRSNLWSTGALFAGVRARLRRRHLLMPAVLLVHVLLLGLLLLTSFGAVAPPSFRPTLNVFHVAAADIVPPAQQQPQPPQTPAPPPIVDLKVETPIEAPPPVFSAAAAEQAGFGTSCEVAELLGRAFADNPLLRAHLARIGPEARSVANAIMIWDGKWVDVEQRAPEDAVGLLRRAIIEGVRAAPAECLGQDVAGPRFIPVKDAAGTTILVLGSATWRWEQLLLEELGPNDEIADQSSKDERPRTALIDQIFRKQ